MRTGSIIRAPYGFTPLNSSTEYYLLGQCVEVGLVHLAFFFETSRSDSDRWRGEIISFPGSVLEEGLGAKLVEVSESDRTLPPSLTYYEGIDLTEMEADRASAKKSYIERIEARYKTIDGLVKIERELLASRNIRDRIRSHASTLTPKQHPDRVSLWYLAYQCFGKDIRALAHAFGNIGNWNRSELCGERKLGRPNLSQGKHSGHSAVPLTEKIVASYHKHAQTSRTLTEIYRLAMRQDFGCKVATTDDGEKILTQPNGDPFPTLNQYRYHIYKVISIKSVARTKLGNARSRRSVEPNEGKFSERTSSILEVCEMDCAFAKERPRQLLSSDPGLPFIVCRIVDVATSCICGIGFSYGGEKKSAYQAALFFCVAPKELMGRLLGLNLTEDQFPCSGISDNLVSDRGPGMSSKLEATGEEGPAIREITPSWSGQSKATVESSHPRSSETEGAPNYVLSDLNVFELARSKVMEAWVHNESSNAGRKMTPEMIHSAVPANPNGIARYLKQRGRDNSRPMALDKAIRNYLTKVTFQAKRDGLYLRQIEYDSPSYRETELFKNSKYRQVVSVDGYIFPLSIRFCWIVHKGRLIEVGAKLPIRDDDQQLNMSLYELAENAKALRALQRDQAQHGHAVAIEAEAEFKEVTGKEMNDGRHIAGSAPPRASTRKNEASVAILNDRCA